MLFRSHDLLDSAGHLFFPGRMSRHGQRENRAKAENRATESPAGNIHRVLKLEVGADASSRKLNVKAHGRRSCRNPKFQESKHRAIERESAMRFKKQQPEIAQ